MAITIQSTTMNGFTEAATGAASGFTVTKRLVSDADIDLKDDANLATLKVAAFGDPLDSLITGTNANPVGRMRLRQTSVVPVAGGRNRVFDAIAKYDQLYTWMKISDPEDEDVTAQLALPVEVEFDATPRSVILFRTGTFGTAPAADLNTTADIGGTKVDYASKPVPGLIPQMKVRVSLLLDVATTGMTLVSAYDRIATASGRWNSTDFLHWAANTVYLETATVSHVRDEYYRCTYNFVWDFWKGCEQVPKTDVHGKAAVDSNGQSQTVTWKSQVRGTYDHNLIFNDQPNSTLAKQIAFEGSFLTYP
jgi:hypothetical protein